MVTAASLVRRFEPRGNARTIFSAHETEVVLSGPSGTGKTRAILEKLHMIALKYAGARILVTRWRQVDLTGSALQTYRRHVLHEADGISYYGGSREEPAQYRYPNGSRMLMSGLDRASKVLSMEFDVVYVNECTEIPEDTWETLTTRLRNGRLPYQQLVGDCNPDAPHHWIKQRAERGQLRLLESRHVDNPALFRPDGSATEYGAAYLRKLNALTGVRLKRFRDGLWAAAEGMVYDEYDPAVHLIDPFDVPEDWPRYWAIDFGYTNPFVWQEWAQDPDGRLYLVRELYHTKRLVEEHAAQIRRETAASPRPRAVICDHDAEGRATLEKHLGIETVGARKKVQEGIQAVKARFQRAGDGRPRVFLFRGARCHDPDEELLEAKRPTCTAQEIESYIWDTSNGRKRGEEPKKEYDHGMDALRYLVAHFDLPPEFTWGPA
jgi:phage terminase large subunit